MSRYLLYITTLFFASCKFKEIDGGMVIIWNTPIMNIIGSIMMTITFIGIILWRIYVILDAWDWCVDTMDFIWFFIKAAINGLIIYYIAFEFLPSVW